MVALWSGHLSVLRLPGIEIGIESVGKGVLRHSFWGQSLKALTEEMSPCLLQLVVVARVLGLRLYSSCL